MCFNVWGSYRCACKPGFRLNPDNRSCTDVDECTEFKKNNLCIGICENTPGSYACKCPDGYKLGFSGRTCEGTLVIFICLLILHLLVNFENTPKNDVLR